MGYKKILACFVKYDQLNHASLTENHGSMEQISIVDKQRLLMVLISSFGFVSHDLYLQRPLQI